MPPAPAGRSGPEKGFCHVNTWLSTQVAQSPGEEAAGTKMNMGLWGWGAGGFLPSYRGVGRMQVSQEQEGHSQRGPSLSLSFSGCVLKNTQVVGADT